MSVSHTFAKDTSVPVARTRGEIDTLLRAWGCDGIAWADDYRARAVTLRFLWTRSEGEQYSARLTLRFPSPAEVKARHAAEVQNRSRYVAPLADTEADRRADQAARAGHRVLLLWIKAALNAVAAGLLTAEEVFLPHMEGSDGRTVAEVALPRLRDLLTGAPASRLLPQGDTDAR